MIMIISLTMFVVLGMVLAAMVIGRQAFNRRELQTAADALALAGAYSLQQRGLPFNQTVAVPYATRNTRLPYTFTLAPTFYPLENRSVVRAKLTGTLDTGQSWFQKLLSISVESQAQINEQIFGERWPALSIVLDASDSMKYPILGGGGAQAFNVMRQVITEYAKNTLPVRNGVVVFNDGVVSFAKPPWNKTNNIGAIAAALNGVTPMGRTNTRAGLRQARDDLTPLPGGHNVILITDGEPTLGGPCPVNEPCHFNAAEDEGDRVRSLGQAALFAVEIRRMNYTSQTTTFLRSIAGGPNTAGNDPDMHFAVQTAMGIQSFMIGLTRSICAFGPLDPGPGAPEDAVRIRAGNPDLAGPPQRVFAFMREGSGTTEAVHPLPLVPNRDTQWNDRGFEYFVDATGAYVILTLNSCNYLGADPDRRLIVRWDDAQLSQMPY